MTDYPHLDSYQLILKCIDDMLINKYNNYIFYVHNLGHFDIIFIYNVLIKSNFEYRIWLLYFKYYNENIILLLNYILNTTMRYNIIINLDIKIKSYSKTKVNDYKYIKISFLL